MHPYRDERSRAGSLSGRTYRKFRIVHRGKRQHTLRVRESVNFLLEDFFTGTRVVPRNEISSLRLRMKMQGFFSLGKRQILFRRAESINRLETCKTYGQVSDCLRQKNDEAIYQLRQWQDLFLDFANSLAELINHIKENQHERQVAGNQRKGSVHY